MKTMADLQTERAFQQQVLDLAATCGWTLRYHTWSSLHSQPGWPDLVLYHPAPPRLVFAELKRNGKEPTPAQQAWLDALRACGQEAFVWHPDDWPEVERVLTEPRQAAQLRAVERGR